MSPLYEAPARRVEPPLGPGALADRLAELPVTIEALDVELGRAWLKGYDDVLPRPTAIVALRGLGFIGWGECVAWTEPEQARFATVCREAVPIGERTLIDLHDTLAGAEPYYAAAIEAAAVDLGLRQASTNLFVLSGRPPRPVMVCRSLGRWSVTSAGGPGPAVQKALAAEPWMRIKIDVDPQGWLESSWRELASTERIVVADFKGEGTLEHVELAHRHLPAAWIEDPPAAAIDPNAPWRSQVAFDACLERNVVVDTLPASPAAVNVKPARMGGPLEALRLLEAATHRGWASYVGGMFEAGPGRQQARVLASLFTADAWNDLAPLANEPVHPGPLASDADFVGFHPSETR